MKSLLLTLAACALAAAAGDAPFAGDWMGTLDINGEPLRIALHLKLDAGRWSGTFDSLDQGARDLVMDQVEVDGNKLVWKMAAAGIVYEGLQQILKEQAAVLNSPWFHYFISHDPRPVLAGVKVPVLALNGEKDTQVDPA
jgi:fermentation-respiration switch protein FrsA (DUF1100 family)